MLSRGEISMEAAECRHVSDCATDLGIREDDLTELKTPNRGSVFVHGICYSSAVVRTTAADAAML
jgi:hypothetical protein